MNDWNPACDLPEENVRVLVYVEYPVYAKEKYYKRGFTGGCVYNEKWKIDTFIGGRVIAWMQFPEPPGHKKACWNCMNFDWKHEACTLNWNNLDECYYNPDCDDRQLTDCCENHETNPEADWEEVFGG